MPVKIIKDYDVFQRFIDGGKLVICLFHVTWCPRCRYLSPIYRKFSNIYTNAEFIKVDCVDCPDISELNKVIGFPTVFFFEDGVRIDQSIGGDPCVLLKKIEARINYYSAEYELAENNEGFELEPEGDEDAALGNNSFFLNRMKTNCNTNLKELDEKKRSVFANRPTGGVESKFKIAAKSKSNIFEPRPDLGKSGKHKYDTDTVPTVPLLYRVANLPLDEIKNKTKEDKSKLNLYNDKTNTIPESRTTLKSGRKTSRVQKSVFDDTYNKQDPRPSRRTTDNPKAQPTSKKKAP